MMVLITRLPLPDQPYWPGRRWLATADALAWPLLWAMCFIRMPQPTGIVVPVICAVAAIAALQRMYRAVWCNHRYRFTTWRWGRVLATLLVIGWILKLASSL